MNGLQESASGIFYLHSVGIIHRDIKPKNILVGGNGNSAKVADYGISRIATLEQTMTAVGTLVFQAPEISRGERYSFKADVYSFALTTYAICDRVGCGCNACNFFPASLSHTHTIGISFH